jgi:endonuclease YncB( thermonuclease family)
MLRANVRVSPPSSASSSKREPATPTPASTTTTTAMAPVGAPKRLALTLCVLATASTTLFPVPSAAAAAAPSAPPTVVQGRARVVDGDTLVINNERIRLYGVDAPESKQACKDSSGKEYACGQVAAKELEQRVKAGGGTAKCSVRERDQYGRLVASCALPTGNPFSQDEDAGDYMVRRGQAVAYRKITPQYIPAENAAKKTKEGIWQGDFEPPAKWRYDRRVAEGDGSGEVGSGPLSSSVSFKGAATGAPAASAAAAGKGGKSTGAATKPSSSSSFDNPKGCRIKGNISAKGEKIYHLPTDITYEATKIDASTGERYFCSEEEAVAAGWRASRAPSTAPTFTSGAGARRR